MEPARDSSRVPDYEAQENGHLSQIEHDHGHSSKNTEGLNRDYRRSSSNEKGYTVC